MFPLAGFTQDFKLPFFTFINPAAYYFVPETSLLREMNRTRSIIAFFSIGTSTESRAKRSVPSKSNTLFSICVPKIC